LIVLLIMSVIIGAIVGGLSGIGVLGWVAGGVIFILGLPGALIGSFIHGEVSYAQDRADYRQMQADIAAEEAEDERTERLLDALDDPQQVYYDNREQHIHFHGRV